jgi:hypothetical protein
VLLIRRRPHPRAAARSLRAGPGTACSNSNANVALRVSSGTRRRSRSRVGCRRAPQERALPLAVVIWLPPLGGRFDGSKLEYAAFAASAR